MATAQANGERVLRKERKWGQRFSMEDSMDESRGIVFLDERGDMGRPFSQSPPGSKFLSKSNI